MLRPVKVIFLSILFIFLAFTNTFAQIPNEYTDCNDVVDPEFHSLRPYQASPCDQTIPDTAQMCGNDIIIQDSVNYYYNDTGTLPPGNCIFINEEQVKCTYPIQGNTVIEIDMSDAKLPILGNTENVVNSQKSSDDPDFDDATKVNEYLSWYLNGVIGRAEYPYLSLDDPQDISKLIDYSGPLKKLLPWESQMEQRIKTIKNVTENSTIQHDQIVACRAKVLGIPVPCHNGFLSLFDKPLRLSDWKNHLPPLPTDKKYKGKDSSVYWKDYRRWRGDSCTPSFTIPIINKKIYMCFDNPLKPNYWSSLFPYIPFSSTEDRMGSLEVDIENPETSDEDITVTDISFTNTDPANLYFSHIDETNTLLDLLQTTYVPNNVDTTTDLPTYPQVESDCKLLNVRTNPGDSLFAEKIEGTLSYKAEIKCIFNHPSPEVQVCNKTFNVNLNVETKSPLLDDIWSKSVAGAQSVFRRIFPKVGKDGAVWSVLDIPGSSQITYSGEKLVSATNPEIYFSHLGGIQEYFLKGIQTALRPKGYGEPILSGPVQEPMDPSNADINCDLNAPESNLSCITSKEELYDIVLRSNSGQLGNHVMECYNDVIAKAQAQGVYVPLALATWILESNASNYNLTRQDFGVNRSDVIGFQAQIQGFIDRAKDWMHTVNNPECQGQILDNDFHAYALIYRTGNCDPNDETAKQYYQSLQNIMSWWVAPGYPMPQSPTDTFSCN